MSVWTSVDTYITLGITGYSTVKMFLNLRSFDSMSLQVAVTPLISTVRMVFPTVNIPDELVKKVCDAVAEAITDYWKEKATQPVGLPTNSSLADHTPGVVGTALTPNAKHLSY